MRNISFSKKIITWIKRPKNIYLIILIITMLIIGFRDNMLGSTVLIMIGFVLFGLILGLLYNLFKK